MAEDACNLSIKRPSRLIQRNRQQKARRQGAVLPHVAHLLIEASTDRVVFIPANQSARSDSIGVFEILLKARYLLR